MQILKEDVDTSKLQTGGLTNDCKFIHRKDGSIDLVRGSSSVRIFDNYWDKGIEITKIEHAGGTRNPKFQSPEF